MVAEKRLPKMQVGRSSISFYYRKEIEALARGIVDHKTDTGSMKISSVELTALDLLRYLVPDFDRAIRSIESFEALVNQAPTPSAK